MNRTRLNQQRTDREVEGLRQVPLMPQMPQSPGRKTTYTRAELMQRGPAAANAYRLKRLPTLNAGNRLSPGYATAPALAVNRRTSNTTRTHFLPRVAQLGNNNPSNTNGLHNTGKLTRDKSPLRKAPKSSAYLPSTFDNNNTNARGAKLPLPQQQQQLQQQQQQQLQLLSGCSESSSLSNSSNDLRTIKVAKAFRLPDEQNKSFVYLCKPVKKVQELLMVRSLNNSVENLLKDSPSDDMSQELYNKLQLELPESDSCSYCSSLNLPQELALSSAASSSYRGLLETRLQDVRQRAQQLQQLAEQVQRDQSSAREEAEELPQQQQHEQHKQPSPRQQQHEQPKQPQQQHPEQLQQQPPLIEQQSSKIEYVFQNIPTLQREIKLLQQLGEKLEATLRANMQHAATPPTVSQTTVRSLPQTPHDSCTAFYTPRSTLTLFGCGALPIQLLGWRRVQQLPQVLQVAQLLECRRCLGCIREFRIETKTLTQLKTADETQCFYLPLACDGSLQRTSFRKLRENPNVLLQQLRPLTPSRPFNLLEQDAMFFNSLMCPSIATTQPRETGGQQLPLPLPLPLPLQLSLRSPLQRNVESLLVATANATVQCEFPPAEAANKRKSYQSSLSLRRPLLRFGARRRLVAAKREVASLEPRKQSQRLKTILVGIVQVAVFLVLIMAFTYPDIRCQQQ